MSEALIAYHCAPALAGIKPANLAACRKALAKRATDDRTLAQIFCAA